MLKTMPLTVAMLSNFGIHAVIKAINGFERASAYPTQIRPTLWHIRPFADSHIIWKPRCSNSCIIHLNKWFQGAAFFGCFGLGAFEEKSAGVGM